MIDMKQLEAESCSHCENYVNKIFQARTKNGTDSITIPLGTVKGCRLQSEKEWICEFKNSSVR